VKIKGLEALVRKLKKLPDDIIADAKAEIEDAADMIVRDAGNAAPVDLGYLKGMIVSTPVRGGLGYKISSLAHYSAYVEFGTGTYVQVPLDLSAYAKQYIGKGDRLVNLPARPFFFPAYYKHQDELIKSLETMIKRNLNR